MSAVLLWYSLMALGLLHHSVGEECVPDVRNPCIAKCNHTRLDISQLFQYPITTKGGSFKWNPCEGIDECRGQTGVAVCQHADQYYNCGNYESPIYILDSYSPYRFRIEYPGGEQWRISVFEFMEDTIHPETTVTFLSEQPALQYNFLVAGKCVGQPACTRNDTPNKLL